MPQYKLSSLNTWLDKLARKVIDYRAAFAHSSNNDPAVAITKAASVIVGDWSISFLLPTSDTLLHSFILGSCQ